jgi:uncharacterized protein (DUF1778 family)
MRSAACPPFAVKTFDSKMVGTAQMRLCPPYGLLYGICGTIRREDFLMAREGTRSTRLEARLSPETLALVKRAAEIEGRSVSDFVVAAALRAAQRTIAERRVLRLALADQRALADALSAPPKPAPALQRARTAHRRLIAATR